MIYENSIIFKTLVRSDSKEKLYYGHGSTRSRDQISVKVHV